MKKGKRKARVVDVDALTDEQPARSEATLRYNPFEAIGKRAPATTLPPAPPPAPKPETREDEGVRLYRAALAADAALTAELVRAYGEKRAAEARYRFSHKDPGVTAAVVRKLAADEIWAAWMRRNRP